ncbi:MAG: acyl-CoA thioesterase [Bacteroidia bacterium]
MKNHSTDITVRGFHIDVFGHTNNARYLEFMEIARWDALQPIIATGFFAKRNLGFVIVNININYKAASFVNDILEVKTVMKNIGNKSIVVHHDIYDKTKGHAVCDADVTFVIMDLKIRKAVVLEGELREIFERM